MAGHYDGEATLDELPFGRLYNNFTLEDYGI